MTLRDSYGLPKMEKCTDTLGEPKIFSTLNASSGFLQNEIDESDKSKTAFRSHHGLSQFVPTPHLHEKASFIFQRSMDVMLSSARLQSALVHLDDIMVFLQNPNLHIAHLGQVLTLLRDEGVTLKLKKCFFFAEKIDYLEHAIRPERPELL